MELVWIIYAIEVLTNIKFWGLTELFMFVLISHIPIGFGLFMYCGMIAESVDAAVKYKNFILRKSVVIPLIVVFGFGSLFNNLTPNKQTAYLMLGAYGVQTVAETVGKNEDVQKLGKRTLSLVETAISKYEQELSAEKQKPIDQQNK